MSVGTIPDHLFHEFHAHNPHPGVALAATGGAAAEGGTVKGPEEPRGEPTYAEAFPPLSTATDGTDQSMLASPKNGTGVAVGGAGGHSMAGGGQWNKMSLRSTTTTQVFSVPLEERRYKEMSEQQQQFGDKNREQAKICGDIMAHTGVTMEMSLAKDQSLTVVITGKQDAVLRARKMMVEKLQTQTKATLHIPKEHHRYILGAKGKKLRDLELQTATKISVPRPNEDSGTVTITGTREGIERARHELQLISDEQAKLAFERLSIPKVYHPFICGPDNATVRELGEQTGARISVPSHSVLRDEVVISGEKEGVLRAKETILNIYEEKKRKTTTVSVEVKKSQHRYIIGLKGAGLSEILAETGVSVEVPPIEAVSETITLRGEPDRLGPALTLVYAKANSVVVQEVAAPTWLHRFVIGRQGANVRRITQDYPRVHIEFTDEHDHIRIEGPPDDVEQARAELDVIIRDLIARMAFVELDIDPKYHRHIIGRQGVNVMRIKNEYDVDVRVPADSENSRVVRVEGVSEGVAHAKRELLELVDKMENEKTRDMVVEHRLHRLIIGTQGARIRELRDRFPSVQVAVPDAGLQSDIIKLRGPKGDVDKCFSYLQKLVQELIVTNHTAEVRVYKQYYRELIGRNAANINKIKEETDTRIELPGETSDCYLVLITGTKENVEQARTLLEAAQTSVARIQEVTVEIPHSQHALLQGARGQLIRAIRDDCGGVTIRFPAAPTADKILIRGPAEDVEKARTQLLQLASEQKEAHCMLELRARPEHHRFLIGRGGANVRELQRRTGVRVVFPPPDGTATDLDLITLIGRQDAIEAVKRELEGKLLELDNTTEVEMLVDHKHHRAFMARKGELLTQISEEFGGMVVSFPRAGVKSDRVVLKGAKNCVEGAQARVLEIVKELESQVTLDCVIPQKFHGLVMGPKGQHVNDICREHNVNIKLPERAPANHSAPSTANHRAAAIKAATDHEALSSEAPTNGDEALNEAPSPNEDSRAENEGGDCDRMEGEVGAVSPEGEGGAPTGAEGAALAPAPPRKQDIILITGQRENCEAASEALLALLPVTEEVLIANELHRYIIGAKGRDVRRIMADCDVNISVPPADVTSDVVRVTGSRVNVARARVALEQRVAQLGEEREQRALRGFRLELRVDPKHHPKIIGRRGAVINKIRADHDVQIQFPERASEASDLIAITGLEASATRARDDILKIVQGLEDLVVEEVELDHRIHSRLIGSRGRGIHKIMDDFKVDIKFPGRESADPDLVVITGASEEAVLECKDHLLNLEDEFLQDVSEAESTPRYQGNSHHDNNDDHPNPSSHANSWEGGRGGRGAPQARGGGGGKGGGMGYTVRGAPWSAPDTASRDDFPDLGLGGSTTLGGGAGHHRPNSGGHAAPNCAASPGETGPVCEGGVSATEERDATPPITADETPAQWQGGSSGQGKVKWGPLGGKR